MTTFFKQQLQNEILKRASDVLDTLKNAIRDDYYADDKMLIHNALAQYIEQSNAANQSRPTFRPN